MQSWVGALAGQIYFDLKTAKGTIPWLKEKLREIEDLRGKERSAVDIDSITLADELTEDIKEVLNEIQSRGIVVRDLATQLIDFPAIINDFPAYLCWKTDEEDLTYWHYFDEGFAGRKSITGEEKILSYL